MAIIYTDRDLAPANNQLAAYLNFIIDEAVTYSYTVLARNTSPTSVDFNYVSDVTIENTDNIVKIPVIGLYANYPNQVRVMFKDLDGIEIFNQIIMVRTDTQVYRDATIFHLNIEHTDTTKFTSVWGNSWLMTTNCDGYDQNGDLRCYYSEPYRNQMLRTHNGYFYIGSDEDEHWYGRRFFKIDILGNVILEFTLRDSNNNRFANTHDLAWDSAGNIYMIGNDNPDRSTNTMRQDASILKFDDNTGMMIWARNYTRDFNNAQILNNSPTNDVHLNSLSWIPAGNVNGEAIIVHTRSTGIIFGISPENGEILWTLNSGGFNGALFANGLDTSGITAFENGAHTVCVTDNSKFVGNTDVSQGKFVLSLFDNRSCVDPDGQAVTRAITADATAEPYQTDPARVMFYAVNLTTNTVTQAQPSIDLPSETVPQITDFMGAVFDHNDYYSIYTNHARSFFISDVNGEIIATVYDVICSLDGYPEFSGECYRARLFAESELNDLIGVGYKVANT
ncbi:aryl-sulfate sulfotransferase N-terminal domain-containing protein [Lelliottia amnigena]|uniref:aryl-sulfate sulfotransferase N-terminal domain-containing protein n=1 Tax=Lelliottia amnigena TaxID=61646 RepID=UPI00192CD3F7|nr:aryl-sulfate sulfotransferase N-terminal domain-containing protein [Lelliottia amnigena]MBL5965888.1 arylsulfotransferase [Lelliottia amnigena]MEA9396847.1 aryl-sulfate sulfotransferase N-terminal domain-containing protein [Lelliottia amnigena]